MHDDILKIKKYVRAANYLTAAQIYLKNNYLLDHRLSFDDIKPRLLGHWGTCPGINFVYANLNYLIKKHDLNMLFVLGPGHGFPALQANLFLEGTLQKYYPNASHDAAGIEYICKYFSWPYGFPSHSNPGAPGAILEGGELGYSLATSYGAILDNPDLIVACLIGDGEAESGPLAGAWHINKLIDPKTNGAVLPILHVNGYKISGPSIFGRMSDKELESLFFGYGYKPIFVSEHEDHDIYETMQDALEKSYKLIVELQHKARSNTLNDTPRYPMIVLRTPKGWTGIKSLKSQKLEGNHLSHQVIGPKAKEDIVELHAVEEWMKSYNFHSLFNAEKGFAKEMMDILPDPNKRMGENDHAFSGRKYRPLTLPDPKRFETEIKRVGSTKGSSMKAIGAYMNEVFSLNMYTKNFRFMSPDETYSNKLDAVFKTTARSFVWPVEPWDKDIAPDGRVMEMLSEHNLQGLAQGYILTGRHATFASYEAFIQIVSSMADQYSKFVRLALETPWRGDMSSMNYILTSSGWRQDHNGFSHQNPSFVSEMMEKHGSFIKAYFPVDANSALAVYDECVRSKNGINVIVAGKTDEPQWLSLAQAKQSVADGLLVWDFMSDEQPDLILCGIGDYVTKESIGVLQVLKTELPWVRIRFVNVVELQALSKRTADATFTEYFTADKDVIFSFHGYPETLKKILFDRPDTERFLVRGYMESGSTTTPFDMHVRNGTSRYNLAIDAFRLLAKRRLITKLRAEDLIKKYEAKIASFKDYILEYGVDPVEIEEWRWGQK